MIAEIAVLKVSVSVPRNDIHSRIICAGLRPAYSSARSFRLREQHLQFNIRLASELNGLESGISLRSSRFRMTWDHLDWFRLYDGRVLVVAVKTRLMVAKGCRVTYFDRGANFKMRHQQTKGAGFSELRPGFLHRSASVFPVEAYIYITGV
jgi:hypothetical protein